MTATGPSVAASLKHFDLVYSNLTANAAPPYFQQTNDCPGVNCPQTNFLASGGLPGSAVPLPTTQAAALGPVSSYTFGGKRPYGLTWNSGYPTCVQEELHF